MPRYYYILLQCRLHVTSQINPTDREVRTMKITLCELKQM